MATTSSNGELSTKLAAGGAALKPVGVHHELQAWFGANQTNLAAIVGTPDEAKKIFTCCLAAIVRNPLLMQCTKESLQQCIRSTAVLKLYPGPLQEVAFVPRRNKGGQYESNFEMQYQGLIKLSVQGGHCKDMSAEVVYENDVFDYDLGTNTYLTHKKALRGPAGEPIAVYAIAKLPDGGSKLVVMTIDEIEAIRRTSRAKDNGPWVDHWAQMAVKTALKRLAKTLVKNTDDQRLAEAIEQDNATERPEYARPAPIVDVGDMTAIETTATTSDAA